MAGPLTLHLNWLGTDGTTQVEVVENVTELKMVYGEGKGINFFEANGRPMALFNGEAWVCGNDPDKDRDCGDFILTSVEASQEGAGGATGAIGHMMASAEVNFFARIAIHYTEKVMVHPSAAGVLRDADPGETFSGPLFQQLDGVLAVLEGVAAHTDVNNDEE
jgi:uncharacterized protein (DUF927 family)